MDFSSPPRTDVLEQYVELFTEELGAALHKMGLKGGGDRNESIQTLARASRTRFQRCLTRSAQKLFGDTIPHSRDGDAIFSYMIFVESHLREPSGNRLFNDVIHDIKVTDKILNPLRCFVSDKELVRLYIKAVVGDKYNVPTIAVLHNPDEAAAFRYPASCCVKPAHLSGHVLFNKEGASVCQETIKEWFLLNQYHKGRQANYRYIPPKVIVEPLIFGKRYAADCKVVCCWGIPRIVYIVVGRPDRIRLAMFDTAWNRLPFSIDCPAYEHDIPRPRNLDEILAVAAALSRPFDFIRVDLYTDSRTIFVGELTNCPQNALGHFPQDGGEQRVSELIFRA